MEDEDFFRRVRGYDNWMEPSGTRFPIQDRSLKIVPGRSRFLNKKEARGEEWYAEQIQASPATPIGGAEARVPDAGDSRNDADTAPRSRSFSPTQG